MERHTDILGKQRSSYIQVMLQGIPEQLRENTSFNVTEGISLLNHVVEKALQHLEQRLGTYIESIQAADATGRESLRKLTCKFEYIEDYIMQTFRNRNIEESATELTPSDYGHENIPQIVLRTILSDFVRDVNLEGTEIMDRLIEDDIMTEDDRHSIVKEATPRRKKEEFVRLMKGKLSYNKLVNNFVPAIEKDHPHVAEKIRAVIWDVANDPSRPTLCEFCRMKQNIQVSKLAGYLLSKNIINEDLHFDLRQPNLNNTSKWEKLISSGPNPGFVVDAVKHEFPDFFGSLGVITSFDCQCQSLEENDDSAFDSVSTDVANLVDVESDAWSTQTYFMESGKPLEEYKMKSEVRGLAILINNMASNSEQIIQKIYNSDTTMLMELLKEKGFSIRSYTNLTAEKMKKHLQEAASQDHTRHDSFVCVIHSELKWKDGKLYLLDIKRKPVLLEDLKKMFNARCCKSLAGKPKIFLLPSGDKRNKMNGTEKDPDEADFLVVRATAPGYGVFPNQDFSASVWVQALKETDQKYAASLDFVSLLTLVSARVGSICYRGYRQSPQIESTLRKLVYFRSDIDDSVVSESHVQEDETVVYSRQEEA